MHWLNGFRDIQRKYQALYVPIWLLVTSRYVYRKRCSVAKWRVDILPLHNERAATTSPGLAKSIGVDYTTGRRMESLRSHHGCAAATSRVHTEARNVLNGQHMLLLVCLVNFCMNYGSIVNGVWAEQWHNNHWVAVVDKDQGTILSGAMVQGSPSCSSLQEQWFDVQWSYGTMFIESW